jgi:hypothetical protein
MSTVGIIANPASGKDIRRLVAHGTVFDNDEKVNIVRRILLGLDAVGVERVLIMPESYGIGTRALDGLELELEASLLPLQLSFTQEDSTRAAALLAAQGVDCIATLGGDGTNRVVAKTCGDVPLMPISTGTNNAFPAMIEGTIAGLAAGLVARGLANAAVRATPRLDVFYGEDSDIPDDIALVDAAIYDERFVASRAIWDVARIKEIILTQVRAGAIGLSAIGAFVPNGTTAPGQGLYLRLGPGGQQVLAPIAPGLVHQVDLAEYRPLAPGDEVVTRYPRPCVLAFDGERETELRPGTTVRLRLNAAGPRVIDAPEAVRAAAQAGVFVSDPPPGETP